MSHKVRTVDALSLALLKRKPPLLQVTAMGTVPSGGYQHAALIPHIYVVPPPDGMQEFDFVAEPPTGPSTAVISPVSAVGLMEDVPLWLTGVRVHSSTNAQEEKLTSSSESQVPL